MDAANLTELVNKAKECDSVALTHICEIFYDKIFNYAYCD